MPFLGPVFVKWTLGRIDLICSKPTSALIMIHPGKGGGCRRAWKAPLGSSTVIKRHLQAALAFLLSFGDSHL